MMMVVIAYDKPNSLELRMKTRPDHLAYVLKFEKQLVYGGPMLHNDGQTMMGSVFVGDFASIEDAQKFNQEDPYYTSGLFDPATVLIHCTRQVYPSGGNPK